MFESCATDLIINGKRVQVKHSTNCNKFNGYLTSCFRKGGRIDSRAVYTPYKDIDFDVFAVLLGRTKELGRESYEHLYFIPMEELKKAGIVRSDSRNGVLQILFYPGNDEHSRKRMYHFLNKFCIDLKGGGVDKHQVEKLLESTLGMPEKCILI